MTIIILQNSTFLHALVQKVNNGRKIISDFLVVNEQILQLDKR